VSSTQVSAPSTSLSVLSRLRERIESRRATVAVVGLGYVGLPLLVAAGAEGFAVMGLDVDPTKIRSLRRGTSYISDVSDEDIAGIPRAQFATDPLALVAADVIVIAVPTPLRDGGPDLSMVRSAAESVARVLRPGQLVVLESTTYPGTTEDLVQPILETTGLVTGFDFALAYSPERIDPGTGRSLRETPKIVAGAGPADTEVAVAFYETIVDRVVTLSSPRNAAHGVTEHRLESVPLDDDTLAAADCVAGASSFAAGRAQGRHRLLRRPHPGLRLADQGPDIRHPRP
jgi:UDP-N-acetyl-D-glucosamine dehydrogenase